MKSVTLEYRNLVRQHINFRRSTWKIIDEFKDQSRQLQQAELWVSQSYPIYDQRYRADPDSPFRLYDCLVPQLKHHVKVPDVMQSKSHIFDIKLHMNHNQIKLNLRQLKYKQIELEQENVQLKEKVKQLREELKTVNYHIEFAEDGRTPREFLTELKQYREKWAHFQVQYEIMLEREQRFEEIANKKVRDIEKKLRDQQTKVIKPLLVELKVCEELTKRTLAQHDKNVKEFK